MGMWSVKNETIKELEAVLYKNAKKKNHLTFFLFDAQLDVLTCLKRARRDAAYVKPIHSSNQMLKLIYNILITTISIPQPLATRIGDFQDYKANCDNNIEEC
jgi:hypothetical protein